jgi:hypothetical protein
MKIQKSSESDEELDIMTPSKTATACKLAQIPPEISKPLSIDAEKWLLNKRKRQQIEDDKLKRSIHLDNKNQENSLTEVAIIPIFQISKQERKNSSKGEEEILNDTVHDQNYNFINKFMEEGGKNSNH